MGVLWAKDRGALDKRGTLHVLAIGVNAYPGLEPNPGLPKICSGPGGTCRLDDAVADARGFHDTIVKQAGELHERVEARLLVSGAGANEAPTRANLVEAVEDLSVVGERDTVVLFLTGHGINRRQTSGDNYYFLTTDARRRRDGKLSTASILSWAALQNLLRDVQGRRILFVDSSRRRVLQPEHRQGRL